jgi:hypothetical protein
MKTKRNKMLKKRKSKKNRHKKTKKWVTAVEAAQNTLTKTGSITKARAMLMQQAAKNSRKLFGSV